MVSDDAGLERILYWGIGCCVLMVELPTGFLDRIFTAAEAFEFM